MATGTNPDSHLIAGLFQEFTDGESGTLAVLPLALEAHRLAPLGFSAESG